jgi:hypothetical protein
MRMRSVFTHSAQAVAEGALIALLVVGLAAGTTFAAKGGGGGGKPGGGGTTSGSGTISLAPMDGATEAHFGARVTFTISTTATVYPYVHLMCYQGGTLVLEGRQGFFPTALGNPWFYLGPTPSWQSGGGNCSANLEQYGGKGWSVLGSTAFTVYP